MNPLERGVDLSQPAGNSSCPREGRRREPRFVPGEANAYVGWWEGETFRAELCTLRNFSTGGAALELAASIDPGETVCFCVVGRGPVNWTPARVVGREGQVARIEFAGPFPYELFELLV
ncbi:MAG: PilZ domain-containing protein [Isosphaeraceae bacterium]|nr:PilZ domain-containing protein [Isosphaeraceae bacterium]